MKSISTNVICSLGGGLLLTACHTLSKDEVRRPNILIAISDDQSDRWPAGDPQALKPGSADELLPMYGIDEEGKHHSDWAFTDVDAAPSKSILIEKHSDEKIKYYFDLAYAKRPEYELFDILKDPFSLYNLCGKPEFSAAEQEMKTELMKELKRSDDPRVVGPDKEIFDSYLRYRPIRAFPKQV